MTMGLGTSPQFDVYIPDASQEPDRVKLADMDGDGDLDAVTGFGHETGFTDLVWFEQGNDPTALWTRHDIATDLIGNPQSLDVSDLDFDGDIDVVAGEHLPQDPGNLGAFVFENVDGVGDSWARNTIFIGDEHHDGTQLADLDGDGDLDVYSIAWTNGRTVVYENLTNQPGTGPDPDFDAISDDFSATSLDTATWTFFGIDGGATLGASQDDAFVAISSPTGIDVSASGNLTTPRLLQDVSDTDFQISAGFLTEPSQTFQEHGLLVVQDDNDFIRFDLAFTSGGLTLIVGVVTGGSTDFRLFQRNGIDPGDVTDFRITRTDDDWTFEYSNDGASWVQAFTTTHAMQVNQVGAFAGSTGNGVGSAPGYTAQLDYFENSDAPILDEDPTIDPGPIAVDDTFSTEPDVAFDIDIDAELLDDDTEPTGEPISFDSFTQPTNGGSLVDNNDGTLTYTPLAGFSGQDSFTYTISDLGGNEDTAAVTISVSSAPQAAFEQLGTTVFDGSNGDVINLPPSTLQSAEGTIAFSFNAVDVEDRQGLFSADASGFAGTGDHVAIYLHRGDLLVRFQDGVNSDTLEFENLSTNQDYEVSATFGASGVQLYVDDVLVDQNAGVTPDLSLNPEFVQLGALGWASDSGDDSFRDPFEGTLTDVRVYDEVLTSDQLLLI